MAKRPYYYVENNVTRCSCAEFEWFGGFALSQKQKCISSLHGEIARHGKRPLEISTKSAEGLGRKLSAFNLKLNGHTLECVFQSAKVFENGGPFEDILNMSPRDAKHDERLKNSGRIKAFRLEGNDWPLEPKTLFYDYIYYQAVRGSVTKEELDCLGEYDAFTDIEFNPEKSVNTQAKSIAIVRVICDLYGCLPNFTAEEFRQLHLRIVKA